MKLKKCDDALFMNVENYKYYSLPVCKLIILAGGGSKLAISVFILFTNNGYLAFSHILLKPSLPFCWFPANIWNKNFMQSYCFFNYDF